MIQAFTTVSTRKDAFEAGNEATLAAMAKLSVKPNMLWVFGAISYDQQKLLEGIAAAAPGVPVIGCTTDGEISIKGLSINSVVVMALASDTIRFHSASVENLSKDSYNAGSQIGKAFQDLDCRYIQIFSDGLSGNADQIIQGIKVQMGEDIKIAGGTAGDGGDVPEGSLVKMTIGNEGDIIKAAKQAAQSAMDRLQKTSRELKPRAIFLYSCMARKIVLGSRTDEEIQAVQEAVGKDVPIIGFYTYGEYCPIGECEISCFHNETATLTVIGE